MIKIKITKKGFKTAGVYVGRGRGNIFGNPYPVKASRYSDKVYSLRESLKLYREYFEKKVKNSYEFKKLVAKFQQEGYVELSCWCINKEIKSKEDIDINNCRCHAEIIAWYLLDEIEKGKEKEEESGEEEDDWYF